MGYLMIRFVPRSSPRCHAQDHRCPQCFPHLCARTFHAAATSPLGVEDSSAACDHRQPRVRVSEDRQDVVIRNDQSEVQRPEACCLIRFVSSVTWLNTLRRSAMRVRIFRSACITVVWSRPPNCCPIFGSDKSVSSRHRYIAI